MHGITDYLIGIVLLLAPNLLGFADVGGAAVGIPRMLGVIILLQALVTDWPVAIARVLPLRAQLMMDYLLGAFLAVSPFLFGFNDEEPNAWLPHVIVGLLILGQAALTRRQTEQALPR
jgi:hypothetical protein